MPKSDGLRSMIQDPESPVWKTGWAVRIAQTYPLTIVYIAFVVTLILVSVLLDFHF